MRHLQWREARVVDPVEEPLAAAEIQDVQREPLVADRVDPSDLDLVRETTLSLDDLVSKLKPPRAVWIMVPSGAPTESTVKTVAALLRLQARRVTEPESEPGADPGPAICSAQGCQAPALLPSSA